MEDVKNKRLNKLFASILALLSMAFVVNPFFEKNPQRCEMVNGVRKRKQSGTVYQ